MVYIFFPIFVRGLNTYNTNEYEEKKFTDRANFIG